MKKNSRILKIVAVLMLAIFIMIPLASCGNKETVAADASGTTHGIAWDFKQATQTLTISKLSDGVMPDFLCASDVPWSGVASSVQTVVIGDGITGIGDYWFYNMSKLTRVDINSKNVGYIGKSAFAFCTSLGSITLSNSVTEIRERAFEASALASIDLPTSVTTIGDKAFIYCDSLTSVSMNGNISEIKEETFYYCNSLAYVEMSKDVADKIPSVSKKEGVTIPTTAVIGGIHGEVAWEYISIDENHSTLSIEKNKITGDVAMGECIDAEWHKYAANITAVVIGKDIVSIGDNAFANMEKLTTVTLTEDVKFIGKNAFKGCSSIKSITFPAESIGNIAEGAFENCVALEIVDITFGSVFSTDGTAVTPTIGERAFAGCAELNTVIIRNDVQIGDTTFENCGKLAKVVAPETSANVFEGKIANATFTDLPTYLSDLMNSSAPAPEQTPAAGDNNGENTDNGEKKGKGPMIALIIMGVVVVGIIIAIILFVRYDKKTSGNNTTVVKKKDGQNSKNAKNTKNGKKGKK